MLLYKNSDKTATIRKQKQRKTFIEFKHSLISNEFIYHH